MKLLCVLLLVAVQGVAAKAPCFDTAETEQWAMIYESRGDYFESWKPDGHEIKSLSPPNGFALGVQIVPWSKSHYIEYEDLLEKPITRKAYPARVQLTWYDLSGDEPKKLRTVGAGANSIQSYQASSIGDSQPNEMDTADLTLFLQRTECFDREGLKH